MACALPPRGRDCFRWFPPRRRSRDNDFRFSILGDRTGDAQPGVYERIWKRWTRFIPTSSSTSETPFKAGTMLPRRRNGARFAPSGIAIVIYFTPGNHDIWSAASRATYEQQTEASGVL